MKIGFLVKYEENLDKWALFADGIGVEGIEIVYQDKKDYEFEPEKIKAALKDRKVKVCAMSMFHINTTAKDPEEREKARKLNCELLQTAAAVHAPIAVMNMGNYEDGNLERNIEEFLKEHEFYSSMAGDLGLTLAYYVGHQPSFVNSKEALARVVEALPDINLKFDPVGLIRNVGADPYDIIKTFGDRITHFHCKDILRNGDYEIEPPVGMGDLAWNKIIAMLYGFGYNDYIVIEPHGPMWSKPDKMAQHILLSKRHLEQFII
ncbi:MAG: sugar phosphate isomerase/epimerase [Clostridiaceae bacterium]|nr:sugar phosphate isomerase/epimerase [Clostridiaceae bacterium]